MQNQVLAPPVIAINGNGLSRRDRRHSGSSWGQTVRLALTIVASLLIGALAATAMLTPIFYVSWRVAASAHKDELARAADLMLQRAEVIYDEAVAALEWVAAADVEPCSPAHILRMRQANTDDIYIDNIAYAAEGYVRCNAYGPVESVIPTVDDDVVLPKGVTLTVNWLGPARPPRPTLVVKLDSHRALVDQRSFYDDLLSPGASQHFTLRTLNGIPIASGRDDASMAYAADRNSDFVAELQSDHWIASINAPGLGFLGHVRSLATLAGLLAGSLTLLLGAGILWFLLRPISGRTLIERALRRRQFLVHYQPIMELETQRCVAAEALVRLRQPDGKLMRPDLFIPYAEDSGLIRPLTDYVIDSVIREMGALLRENRSMHISVNIAATDIVSGRILEVLDRALKDTGVRTEQIWLEMTERGFMHIENARTTLDELRRRGHCIAIDDFGTGYSGLQYLAQLPVDMLKIDKSFIETVGTGAPTSRVTGHIIAIARELKLTLVAEGVETEAQAAFLLEHRVEFAQGWLFSKAVPADDFLAFLRRNRARTDRPVAMAAVG